MIVRNAAECKKCGDVIESTHRHDFVRCGCGAIFVDGGKDYLRRGGEAADMIDRSVFVHEGREVRHLRARLLLPGLRELLDSKCVCTDEAELEICPRCLGLMSWVEVRLPVLLDALDEAEKERDAAQTAHGELFTTFTETEARLDEAEKALREIDEMGRGDHGWQTLGGAAIVARKALARIGTLAGEEDVEEAPLLDGASAPGNDSPRNESPKGSSSAASVARIGAGE